MAVALRSILGDDVNVPSDLEPDSSGLLNSDDIFYRIPVSSDSDSAPFAQTPALLPPPPQTPNFPSQDPQIPENPTENPIPLQLQASSTIGENHVQGMEAQIAAALATCDSAPPEFKREPRDVTSKPKRRPCLGLIGPKDDNDFVILEPMPYEGQEESRGAHGRRESRWDEKLSPTQHLFPLPFNGQTAILPLPSQVLPVPVSEPIGNPSECLLLKNCFDPATKGAFEQLVQAGSSKGNQDILKFKNRLQEFTQRAKMQLPVYRITNEGESHALRFRSSVVVDGNTYVSANIFSSRKAAEKDVAEVAIKAISSKINNWASNKTSEGFPSIYELEQKGYCKLILHESAAKMKIAVPKYEITSFVGALPGFVSSVVFGRVKCTSEACKGKKEAEQNASRQVIVSILGNSGLGTILPEIIIAKAKHFLSGNRHNCSDVGIGVSPLGMDIGNTIEASAIREEVTMDGNAHKAIILIQNASLEAIGVDTDANKAGSLVENVPPMALNEQISDVKPLEVQPNLNIFNCNPKRMSKSQKRKANKKLKAELVNEGVAAS